MTGSSRSYRFGDASSPGVLLGLPMRQAVPVVVGIVWFALCLQTPAAVPGGLIGLTTGLVLAFGRWRGASLFETAGPATRIGVAGRLGRGTWHRPALLGPGSGEMLPAVLDGLELVEFPVGDGVLSGVAGASMAIVRDRRARTLTAALPVTGTGFPLAAPADQDRMLAGWGAALSPFAGLQCPVVQVTWQAWAGPAQFRHDLTAAPDLTYRTSHGGDGSLLDYLALVEQQAPVTREQRVLVTVTIDERRVRRQRSIPHLETALAGLRDEVARFRQRLETGGLHTEEPLGPAGLTATIRLRSDPSRADQLATLSRSLAEAAGHGRTEWGPMVIEPSWSQVRVDGSVHRSFRVAGWPQLPVPADWLGALLEEPTVTRTVCVVLEPVPINVSARAADREAMAREADAEAKGRRGFRVTALDRERLSKVEARERELAEGHAEFRFTGLVDVTAPDVEALEEASAAIEQAAAQSLIDLRPLHARHDQGWVACLPLGRNVTRRSTGR